MRYGRYVGAAAVAVILFKLVLVFIKIDHRFQRAAEREAQKQSAGQSITPPREISQGERRLNESAAHLQQMQSNQMVQMNQMQEQQRQQMETMRQRQQQQMDQMNQRMGQMGGGPGFR